MKKLLNEKEFPLVVKKGKFVYEIEIHEILITYELKYQEQALSSD